MFNKAPIALFVSAIFTLTHAAQAETLIAAGRLRDAQIAMAKIGLEQAEGFARHGVTPRDLGAYLSARYPGAADQRYLHDVLAKISDQTTKVKMRALDKSAKGYVITTPNGTLLQIAQKPKGKIEVNGHALPTTNLEASVETIRRALDKKVARSIWPTLLGGVATADAATAIEYGMIAALIAVIIIGALKTVGKAVADKSAASKPTAPPAVPAPAPGPGQVSLSDHLEDLNRLCESERSARQNTFKASLTGEFAQLLAERNVVNLDVPVRTADCPTAVDRYYTNNPKAEKLFSRGDINYACANLDKFLICVKSYREESLHSTTPAQPGGAITPAQPGGGTTPEQGPGETTPSGTAH